MYHCIHHPDDGLEREYWFVQNDSVPGSDSEVAFDTERECVAEVDRLNREEGHYA